MKSSDSELRNRGMCTEEEIHSLKGLPFSALTEKLHSGPPHIRSGAAINLRPFVNEAAEELLLQLSKEKCLYTRIAICESLQEGDKGTAERMTKYLGKIGNNQYKSLPLKVSGKKSFPLPRDIIARSLGKMDRSVFPVLMKTLEQGTKVQVQEALDAVGFIVFYNPSLASQDTCGQIIALPARYGQDPIILWKVILCLSAFPCSQGIEFLLKFKDGDTIFSLEARRSLAILEQKGLEKPFR